MHTRDSLVLSVTARASRNSGKLPEPRGTLSAGLVDLLIDRTTTVPSSIEPDDEDDLQLSLFICYELAYHGWQGVDDAWEWHPGLLGVRAQLEHRFEAALVQLVGPPPAVVPANVPSLLAQTVAADDGPPLSKYLRGRATREQFREFVTHRSVYHLREADPHTWAIPRLSGRAKAALVEIQTDEYGGGTTDRMHQEMFKKTMRWFGLDLSYGAYVDAVTAPTLAVNNLMSFFGLHRRRRGAVLGHLAAYEMTSTLPNRAYGNGIRRLGGTDEAAAFYDEHVEADAVHEQIAAHDLCGSFATEEPELAGDVLWGAHCALAIDAQWANSLLKCWERNQTSLRW